MVVSLPKYTVSSSNLCVSMIMDVIYNSQLQFRSLTALLVFKFRLQLETLQVQKLRSLSSALNARQHISCVIAGLLNIHEYYMALHGINHIAAGRQTAYMLRRHLHCALSDVRLTQANVSDHPWASD